MKQMLAITGVSTTVVFIIFLVLQGIGTDLIDDFIERDLDAGVYSDVSITNYILSLYMLAMLGAFAISTVLVLKTTKAMLALLLAVALAFTITFTVALAGLYGFPGFILSGNTFGITLALYAIFVLRSPATYLGLFGVVLVASQFSINIIASVHHETTD